ncbi:MAG: TonB-dependent receptor family protein [Bacteroidales bacterium]|nr:TonB-dependent receptor family protein [Bacteroidales bacterium]MCF8402472.1 TonB-dependent receptor family protein [Bacteroidales bacterium]
MQLFIKYIALLAAIFLISFATVAGESELGKGGKIEGQVIDAGTNTPVEFANVVVFSSSDSSMVAGGITGEKGDFNLSGIPDGTYYVRVQFIGYESRTVNDVIISDKGRKFDLGMIPLGMSAVTLEGAVVTADKMAVEYKIDRKVINVGQDLDAAGASAIEVLEKVPSIRVDINGDVFLRGSSNFTVLIDGKPSVLDGNEALQQIPASTIENIEIITNPSAKFDPDGTAGIINIKLKHNILEGFSGMINTTAGTGEKYASDLYLNYKTGSFNFYGGLEWNDRKFPGTGTEKRETLINDTIQYREAETEMAWMRHGLTFKGGVDYSMDKSSKISVGGEYGSGGFGMDNYGKIHEYTDPITYDDYYINDNSFRWSRNYYSLNANYKRKFEQEGHELNLFGFFSERDGAQKQTQSNITTDNNWNVVDQYPDLLRSVEEGPSQQYRVELDYTKPVFTSGKLETGYQFRRNNEKEDYFLETFDYDKSEWITDDSYTKYSTFERNIHALYGVVSNEFKGFEYQLGLRGEYTYRNTKVINTGESALVDRLDYFPSLHIAKKVMEKNQFMLSYSRRIDRPRGWYLEPSETYIDENTRRIGNPALLPEYTDSYELGYMRSLAKGSLSLETYYRVTDNKITSIQRFDEETGILYTQFQNLNNDKALGLEGSVIYDINKWFNLNWSATFYNYRLEDKSSEGAEERTSNNWDTRLVTSFKLPTNTRLQLNLSYNSPTVSAQGRVEESYGADFTIRQEFFEKKFSAVLKVGDIFATQNREYTSRGVNFYTYEYRKPESRVVTLTLSYRINNFKEQKQERRIDVGGDM